MKKTRGRPDQGKLATLKKRSVYIYLDTEEMVGQWKSEAEKNKLSLSRWVTFVVDDHLLKKRDGMTRGEALEKEIQDAKNENASLKEKLAESEAALKRTEMTVADYRERLANPLISKADSDMTDRVIRMLVENKAVEVDQLPILLNVDVKDSEAMRRVHESTRLLKSLGLMETDIFEWRWKGGVRSVRRKPNHVKRKRKFTHHGIH